MKGKVFALSILLGLLTTALFLFYQYPKIFVESSAHRRDSSVNLKRFEFPDTSKAKIFTGADLVKKVGKEASKGKRGVDSLMSLSDTPESKLLNSSQILTAFETREDSDGNFSVIYEGRSEDKFPNLIFQENYNRDSSGKQTLLDRVVMVADHILVRVNEQASPEAVRSLAMSHGGEVVKKVGSGSTYLIKISKPGLLQLQKTMQAFDQRSDLVYFTEPDFLVFASIIPNDPSFLETWGMHNTGQTQGTVDADIDSPEGWEIGRTSPVTVAIVDTGIDYLHPDLVNNIWTNSGEIAGNGKDDDQNGYVDDIHGWDFINDDADPMDDNFHGTHCAGTVGAVGNNGVGVAGVAWSVKLAALKFLSGSGSGAISDAADAIAYANRMNFPITSNSWGGGGFNQTMYEEIARAQNKGALFIAAAGNNGRNNDLQPFYPAVYDHDAVLSVAATDHNDQIANFSNYGKTTVDVGAPGVNTFSTFPRTQTAAMLARTPPLTAMYGSISGTSMATPHVSGLAAILLASSDTLSGAEVKKLILNNSDIIPALTDKSLSGGRINLLSAVSRRAARVHLSSFQINDGPNSPAVGNGDGLINPGETAALSISLVNRSQTSYENVSAVLTLKNPDSNITIGSATTAFGTIAPNQSKPSVLPFTFQVSQAATVYKRLNLVVTVSGTGLPTVAHEIRLWVYPRIMASGMVTLDGVAGQGVRVEYRGAISGETRTNSQGIFNVAVLEGPLTVLVTLPNGSQGQRQTAVTGTNNIQALDFAFSTVARGTVRDQSSNALLSGIGVTSNKAAGTVVTDQSGNYSVAALNASGTYTIRAKKFGEYLSQVREIAFSGTPQTANFLLKPGAYYATYQDMPPGTELLLIANSNEKLDWVGSASIPNSCAACNHPVVSLNRVAQIIYNPNGLNYEGAAIDVNNNGEVVGYFNSQATGVYTGFRWKAGQLMNLPPLPGYQHSVVLNINDSGVAVGYSGNSITDGRQQRATMWSAAGAAIDLGLIDGKAGSADFINNKGDILFTASSTGAGNTVATSIYRRIGSQTAVVPYTSDLCPAGNGFFSPLVLNEQGDAVLFVSCANRNFSYIYRGNTLLRISLAGEIYNYTLDLNEKSQAVGLLNFDSSSIFGSYEPFLFDGVDSTMLVDSAIKNNGTSANIIFLQGVGDDGQLLGTAEVSGFYVPVFLKKGQAFLPTATPTATPTETPIAEPTLPPTPTVPSFVTPDPNDFSVLPPYYSRGDFDGDRESEAGVSASLAKIGRRSSKIKETIVNFLRYSSSAESKSLQFENLSSQAVNGRYQSNETWQFAFLSKEAGNKLTWNIFNSSDSKIIKRSFGKAGDTVIAGCDFAGADRLSDEAILKRKKFSVRDSSSGKALGFRIKELGKGSVVGIACADFTGDRRDELVALVKYAVPAGNQRKTPTPTPEAKSKKKAAPPIVPALAVYVFNQGKLFRSYNVSSKTTGVYAADFDRDGNAELLTYEARSRKIGILGSERIPQIAATTKLPKGTKHITVGTFWVDGFLRQALLVMNKKGILRRVLLPEMTEEIIELPLAKDFKVKNLSMISPMNIHVTAK